MLWFETVGFLMLICLSWLDELVPLPHVLFGSGASGNWREALLESIALAAVGILVLIFTWRLAQPTGSIEVCIWCRKIRDGYNWLATEEYFGINLDVALTQCMCPTCRQRWKNYGPLDA